MDILTNAIVEQEILTTLKLKGLNINSNWDRIEDCFREVSAPIICINVAIKLRLGAYVAKYKKLMEIDNNG